ASGHAFHDLGRAGVEGERGGEDDADRLRRAVGELDAVADALAVEVNVGLGGDGDAVDLGGNGHEVQIPYSIPSNFWMMPLATKPTKPMPKPRNIHIMPKRPALDSLPRFQMMNSMNRIRPVRPTWRALSSNSVKLSPRM